MGAVFAWNSVFKQIRSLRTIISIRAVAFDLVDTSFIYALCPWRAVLSTGANYLQSPAAVREAAVMNSHLTGIPSTDKKKWIC